MATKTELKFRPLNDRVLIQRKEGREQEGGIILPDAARKKQEIAQVLAVGPGKKDSEGKVSPMEVRVGDQVLIDRYAGQEISLEGEEYLIVRQDDIVAIVE